MRNRSKGEPRGAGDGIRLLRVAENMRHAIVTILSRDKIMDDDLYGVSVTVTQVDVSPDLRNATVYVQPLAGVKRDDVVKALNKNTTYIRGQLSKAIRLKYMPHLKFAVDNSFDEADKIDALLRRDDVRRDLLARDPESDLN